MIVTMSAGEMMQNNQPMPLRSLSTLAKSLSADARTDTLLPAAHVAAEAATWSRMSIWCGKTARVRHVRADDCSRHVCRTRNRRYPMRAYE